MQSFTLSNALFSVSHRVITRVSSAPDLNSNIQTVPSSASSSNEQHHMIELLQRQPLPTLSPST